MRYSHGQMFLLVLVMASLACGVNMNTNAGPVFSTTDIPSVTPSMTVVEGQSMTVLGTVWVRQSPNGLRVSNLDTGDVVTVYEVKVYADIGSWCRISPLNSPPRFVACRWLEEK